MKALNKGIVFKEKEIIPLRKNQTISISLFYNAYLKITIFSMYEDTEISEESYTNNSFMLILSGKLNILSDNNFKALSKNDYILVKRNTAYKLKAKEDTIFLEISYEEDNYMENIEKGIVLSLKDKIDYIENGISNLDILKTEGAKILIMAISKGEDLKPHSAPFDALLIALEGKALVSVGDKDMELNEGEEIVFPKDIIHNVCAITDFKMLLIMAK